MKIAPSMLSADFTKLLAEIKEIEQYGADYLPVSYTHLTLPTT